MQSQKQARVLFFPGNTLGKERFFAGIHTLQVQVPHRGLLRINRHQHKSTSFPGVYESQFYNNGSYTSSHTGSTAPFPTVKVLKVYRQLHYTLTTKRHLKVFAGLTCSGLQYRPSDLFYFIFFAGIYKLQVLQ